MCMTLKNELEENKGILFSCIIPSVFGIIMFIYRKDSQIVPTLATIEKIFECIVIFVIFIVKYYWKKKKRD